MMWEVSVDRYVEGGYILAGKKRLFLFELYDDAAAFAENVRRILGVEEKDLCAEDRRRLQWVKNTVCSAVDPTPGDVNVDQVEAYGRLADAYGQIDLDLALCNHTVGLTTEKD